MRLELLNTMNGRPCSCGRVHRFSSKICTGSGAVKPIAELVKALGGTKAFVLADTNTYAAAGQLVCRLLTDGGIALASYIFPDQALAPDERSVGAAVMHYPTDCDVIVAVGSGVINDIGKILSHISGRPYIIVATAPSMDGYASASSSMTRDGLKISLPTRSADVIIGDTDILRQAPVHMMKAGLGDMLAKYVSICEWRISNLITGEYYCPEIATLIRQAVKRCVDNAAGLLLRDSQAVEAVFEGLVIGGVAMNYAGLSRPASGVEHYISHILDMRAVEFDTPAELHGIQCAIGTVLAARAYEKIKVTTPDRKKALAWAKQFDFNTWSKDLRNFLGKGAQSMIAAEEKDKKYDPALHGQRLEVIIKNWPQILEIIEQEIPDADTLERLLLTIAAPTSLGEIGIDPSLFPLIFKATKDIRDKYVLSRLAWDLGILEEIL